MKEILKSDAKDLYQSLSRFLILGPRSVQEHHIDCSNLDERFLKEDIRFSNEFSVLFDDLSQVQDSPCLYVFEIESEISTDEILNSLVDFGHLTEKVIPKIKTKISSDSKVLYVGKVNNSVWGRLITHLGFHTHKNNGDPKASNNHGLQLYFWAKNLSLKLKFTVVEFENDMKEILPVLEKQLAKKLNPIVGEHK